MQKRTATASGVVVSTDVSLEADASFVSDFPNTGKYAMRNSAWLRVGDSIYTGNAALYVLMQHLAGSKAEKKFLASIARGEDCA